MAERAPRSGGPRVGAPSPAPQAGAWVSTTYETADARRRRGRQARKRVARSAQAAYEPAADRPDPVALLEEQARDRVPELRPIRYGRMLASPFAFFRGSAQIMAWDLARMPHSGLETQLCGDAHLGNFGLFGSPERQLVFDLNDFDETLPGPWEWDLKRLASSVEVASRENGLSRSERRQAVLRTVARYREAMAEFAAMANLDVWYAQLSVDRLAAQLAAQPQQLSTPGLRRAERTVRKARRRDHLRAVRKLTTTVGGDLHFLSDPPLLVPIEELPLKSEAGELERRVHQAIAAYHDSLPAERRTLLERYRLAHIARKVVGVGSVGTRVWVVLMLGRDQEDAVVLQLKEAGPSVLERFLSRSSYDNAGQRVVAGQRLMQAASDIFLGWQRMRVDGRDRDFYFRQLYDWKGSAEVEELSADEMVGYGELCAWTLARAHARAGDRIAIAAYLGTAETFDQAIVDFADRYAEQNERDFAALTSAAAEGRIAAERPV